MAYLDAAWLAAPRDALAEAAAAAGVDVCLARAVSGAPDGEARYTARVAGGSVQYEAGLAEDADVTLTDTYAGATAQVRGELGPNASFMQGRTKVVGHTGRWLAVLAATGTDAYESARAEVAGLAGLA